MRPRWIRSSPPRSKAGRIRTHCVGFGNRLLSQEHDLVKASREIRTPASAMARRQAAELHHGRIKQFRRLELNQLLPGFIGTLDLRAAPETQEPAAGVEPACSALRKRRSADRASPAYFRVAGGSRTRTTPVHSRIPQPLWVRPQYLRQESNLHNLRLRRAACIRHTPGISRTAPRPGVEPGPRRSKRRMISVSPPRRLHFKFCG